jgi:tetratricopeptide (TPR) repeat protein
MGPAIWTARQLCLGMLFLALSSLAALAQVAAWKSSQDAGDKAYRLGHYAEAESQFKAALKAAEAFGPQDPRLALDLYKLAEVYRAEGKYAVAEPLQQRSLAIRETSLGPEHPDVAESLNGLALLYQAQHRYADAEALYQRSLAISRKALGTEHPNVAVQLNNLAKLYRDQERPTRRSSFLSARCRSWRRRRGRSNPM